MFEKAENGCSPLIPKTPPNNSLNRTRHDATFIINLDCPAVNSGARRRQTSEKRVEKGNLTLKNMSGF